MINYFIETNSECSSYKESVEKLGIDLTSE